MTDTHRKKTARSNKECIMTSDVDPLQYAHTHTYIHAHFLLKENRYECNVRDEKRTERERE